MLYESLRNFDDLYSVWDYGTVYAAFHKSILIGYMSISDDELISFYVCPEWRNKGLGNALLERYSPLVSHVMVWRDNKKAFHLYNKYGFRKEIHSTETVVVLGK
ncbi:hypothetical protein HOU08_gp038 [Dickeya phage vB_DsoM_JA29]|uniref:N-acetyltransferase domain-containing protein n=1 Tax=Dickeya phage vB_DsoM_JA29 TaxID=2283031 RepID=A0A384ZX09_9CAUD|nr:hypothetical protein HOU08_gp038 [Dickeya phage vB_DsoM_JA29]AXG66764.1 hypothetical protein JA29_038 [Dickeya phage vB_DsoM_JA29]